MGVCSSTAPLGFTPDSSSGEPPLLVTGDVAGLESLAGLSGVYRTHSWLSVPALGTLHSWQLASFEARLQRAQTQLLTSGSLFSLSGPFNALDAARAQASAAPKRLLLVGGGALAALTLFLVLAAGGLKRDQGADVARLRAAGARNGQIVMFVVGECAWLCALGLLLGACLAVAVAAVLAAAAGLPAGGVLMHSLVTAGAVARLGRRTGLHHGAAGAAVARLLAPRRRRACGRGNRGAGARAQPQREWERPTDRPAGAAVLPSRGSAGVSRRGRGTEGR